MALNPTHWSSLSSPLPSIMEHWLSSVMEVLVLWKSCWPEPQPMSSTWFGNCQFCSWFPVDDPANTSSWFTVSSLANTCSWLLMYMKIIYMNSDKFSAARENTASNWNQLNMSSLSWPTGGEPLKPHDFAAVMALKEREPCAVGDIKFQLWFLLSLLHPRFLLAC